MRVCEDKAASRNVLLHFPLLSLLTTEVITRNNCNKLLRLRLLVEMHRRDFPLWQMMGVNAVYRNAN